MRQALFASAAILALSAPCYAAEQRASLTGTVDQHIRVVPYSATKRVTVTGVVGQPTTFTFPAGEQVFGIAQTNKIAPDRTFTDSGWYQPQGPADKDGKDLGAGIGNNLSLWPVTPGTTIMEVTTVNKDGVQKPYAFKLVAKPAPTTPSPGSGISLVNSANAAERDPLDDPDATFNVIFKGGAPAAATEKAERVATAEVTTGGDPVIGKAKRGRARRQMVSTQEINNFELAQDRLRTDSFNRDTACHYVAHGPQPSSIEPRCPMTNRQWVLMRFPGLSKKPAVYIVEQDGDERLARQHGGGDFVVIEEIAQHFRLRLGSAVLDIVDNDFNPGGAPTNSGTIAASVDRKILKAQPAR